MVKDWNEQIRQAVRKSGRSINSLARDTGLKVAPLQRFMAGKSGLTVKSAERIGAIVGLELVRKGAK